MSSDNQFSLLSPNSSNDLEIMNNYFEESELYDQETMSILSDASVANLQDFDDIAHFKNNTDPFLFNFFKDDNDEISKAPTWSDSALESGDIAAYLSSLAAENSIDDYLPNIDDCIDNETPDLLDWDSSLLNPSHIQKHIPLSSSNKRAFNPVDNFLHTVTPLPTKKRRVEVSSHIKSDEWINKSQELPQKILVKENGVLDRRKTKHHKILNEYENELQIENIDSKKQKLSLHITNTQSPQNTHSKFPSQKPTNTVNISSYSDKVTESRSIRQNHAVSRKPSIIYTCKNNTISNKYPKDLPEKHISESYHHSDLKTDSSSITSSDIVEIPKIPAPLRMGKRVSRRGNRLSLWQFLMCLLDSHKYREHSTGIKWISRNNGVFHIVDSKQVATLWGQYKERREKMTYDSLARSLRHYYKKNLMAKINNRRLVYQIAQECLQWSTDTFLKRSRQ